ncbi:MAG: hypothetical protein ACYSXF_06600 [Planctomycetota bacterium]|jgi:hypothetical protein
MSREGQEQQIDALIERAAKALAKDNIFEAERLAAQALGMARGDRDFERLARCVPPLRQARGERLRRALDVGKIKIIDSPPTRKLKPGCYLVQPPQVGADARELRLSALEGKVAVAVVCREPSTMIGLCPIVAISPGATIRTKIDSPQDPEHPDMEWFVEALEALGDWAIETIDPALEIQRRVETILVRLDAIPEHDGLLQCLEHSCHEAQRALDNGDARSQLPPSPRSKTKVES